MTSLDLRRHTTPPAPAAPPAPKGMPINAGMPLPAGQILRLTPEEEQTLLAVGWAPGQPIPNMAEALAAVRQDMEHPPLPSADLPPLQLPAELDIASLPEDRQAELRRGVQAMIQAEQERMQREAQRITDPGAPELNDTIETVAAGREQFKVTLTRPAASAAPAAPGPEPAAAESAPVDPPASAGADVGKSACAYCGFAGTADSLTDPSAQERQDFVTMMLTGARMIKSYDMLNGAVRVAFKTLTRAELDMALTQAGCDQRDNKIPDQGEFFRRVQNYEMVLALHSIGMAGHKLVTLPFIADVQVSPREAGEPFQTPLADYYDYVTTNHITTSAMLRTITVAYNNFNAMVRRLEGNVENPDFWSGIGTPT